MARKCSHCGNNGHNSRTCSNPRSMVGGGGLRLFGVQLHIASPMRKSFSMDCLSSSSMSRSSSSTSLVSIEETADKLSNGYISDGLIGRNQERKKGVPWTEEEHRTFLAGLEKLGKGDWRGISRNFVTTRTPTQVASHAQKYFLRQSSLTKKKRRSSLFDVVGTYERAVDHTTESSKFKDPSFFCDLQSPALYQVADDAPIDLNSSGQETQSPSCLHLLPSCPAASLGSSPSHVTKPSNSMSKPNVHLPDLELTISSSRSPLDQNKSDHPTSLRMGTIRVI